MPEANAVIETERSHFEVFDLADEDQIVAELQGRVTTKFVYQLKGVKDPETGEDVVGLSYAGTNWACREYAKQGEAIRIMGDPKVTPDPLDPDYIIVVVNAQRWAVNTETGKEIPLDSTLGVKRQWRKMKKNRWEKGRIVGEDIVPDAFFVEKGFSKAIRNAKQALMPTDLVRRLVQQAIKAKQAGAPRDEAPPGKPPRDQAAPKPESRPGPAAAAGTGAGKAPSAQPKETLVQKFEIVLKAALGTQDGKAARQALKKIQGTENIGDLSEEDLKKYGKILQGITKGVHAFSDDGTHVIEKATGAVMWGKRPEPPPAAQESPAPETPPAQEEQLF